MAAEKEVIISVAYYHAKFLCCLGDSLVSWAKNYSKLDVV